MTGFKHFVDFEKTMGLCTAQCKMLLFCVKTVVKELHDFEVARLKKKAVWQLSNLTLS